MAKKINRLTTEFKTRFIFENLEAASSGASFEEAKAACVQEKTAELRDLMAAAGSGDSAAVEGAPEGWSDAIRRGLIQDGSFDDAFAAYSKSHCSDSVVLSQIESSEKSEIEKTLSILNDSLGVAAFQMNGDFISADIGGHKTDRVGISKNGDVIAEFGKLGLEVIFETDGGKPNRVFVYWSESDQEVELNGPINVNSIKTLMDSLLK